MLILHWFFTVFSRLRDIYRKQQDKDGNATKIMKNRAQEGPKVVQNGAKFVQDGSKLEVLGAMLTQVVPKLGVAGSMLPQVGRFGGACWAMLARYWGLVGQGMATRPQDGRKGGPREGGREIN